MPASLQLSMTWPQYLRGECSHRGSVVKLSPKQSDLLLLYLLRRGTIVPVTDVVEFLWPNPDDEPEYSWNFVRKHSHYLEAKLPGALCLEHGRGRIIDREAA